MIIHPFFPTVHKVFFFFTSPLHESNGAVSFHPPFVISFFFYFYIIFYLSVSSLRRPYPHCILTECQTISFLFDFLTLQACIKTPFFFFLSRHNVVFSYFISVLRFKNILFIPHTHFCSTINFNWKVKSAPF